MNFCIQPEQARGLVLLFTLCEHTVFCSAVPRPPLIAQLNACGDLAVIAGSNVNYCLLGVLFCVLSLSVLPWLLFFRCSPNFGEKLELLSETQDCSILNAELYSWFWPRPPAGFWLCSEADTYLGNQTLTRSSRYQGPEDTGSS